MSFLLSMFSAIAVQKTRVTCKIPRRYKTANILAETNFSARMLCSLA